MGGEVAMGSYLDIYLRFGIGEVTCRSQIVDASPQMVAALN